MAENSAISWTTHTFNPWSLSGRLRVPPQRHGMGQEVATLAESDAVSHIEPEGRKVRKGFYVVRVEVATAGIPAMSTGKSISHVDVESPPLQLSRRPEPSTFEAFAVDVSRRLGTAQRFLSCRRTDLGSGFRRVLGAEPIARSSLSGGAHFGAALGRHRLALHGRDEAGTPFFPALPGRIAAGVRHG